MNRITPERGVGSVLAALAGLLLAGGVVAGCSSSGGSGGLQSAAPSLRSASARSAPQMVAAAYTNTTRAGTAKTAVVVHMTVGQGRTQRSESVQGAGVVNFANRSTDLTMQIPRIGSIEARYLAGTVYIKLPPSLASKVPGHEPWISIDVDKVAKQKLGASLQQLQASMPALQT